MHGGVHGGVQNQSKRSRSISPFNKQVPPTKTGSKERIFNKYPGQNRQHVGANVSQYVKNRRGSKLKNF